MARHITDGEIALERAQKMTDAIYDIGAPGLLRTAGYNASKGGRKLGKVTLSTLGAASSGIHAAAEYGGMALGVATGIAGMAAVPLTVVNAAYHMTAVYSTAWHVTSLKALRTHAKKNYFRWKTSEGVLTALDYAIDQKTEKAVRRSASAVPGVSVLSTLYTVGRGIYKRATGSLGEKRKGMANVISEGIIHADLLAMAIALEIVGPNDFAYIIGTDGGNHVVYSWQKRVTAAVFEKMKST